MPYQDVTDTSQINALELPKANRVEVVSTKNKLALLVGNQLLQEGESIEDIKIEKIWDTPDGYVATISRNGQQTDVPIDKGIEDIAAEHAKRADSPGFIATPQEETYKIYPEGMGGRVEEYRPTTTGGQPDLRSITLPGTAMPAPTVPTAPTEEDNFAAEMDEMRRKYTVLPNDTPTEAAFKEIGLRKATMEKAIQAEYIKDKTNAEDDEYLQNLASARHTLLQQKIYRWSEELELGIKTIKDDDRFDFNEKRDAIALYLARTEDPISVPSVPKAEKLSPRETIVRQLMAEESAEVPTERPATITPPAMLPPKPTGYPDAVWSEQHKLWTIIRNGRLMGIR